MWGDIFGLALTFLKKISEQTLSFQFYTCQCYIGGGRLGTFLLFAVTIKVPCIASMVVEIFFCRHLFEVLPEYVRTSEQLEIWEFEDRA